MAALAVYPIKDIYMQEIDNLVRNVMLDNGMTPPDTIITDGHLHRFNDESGKPNNYYTVHCDGRAAGIVGSWKTGIKVKFKAEGQYPKLTDQQRLDFKIERHRQQLIRKAEQLKLHNDAARKAAYINQHSIPVINHPYLSKKRVKAHGLRIYKGSLVIPVFNQDTLVSVQLIDDLGTKRFLAGSKLKGSYSQLGQYLPDKPILITEGWATGASLFESTGNQVFIAFSAGNLKDVAQYVRSLHPTNQIIIMGDNDLSGVGQIAAREAALAIGGKYLIPETEGFDWNDVVNKEMAP
jgi:putative DNA primase/helicase